MKDSEICEESISDWFLGGTTRGLSYMSSIGDQISNIPIYPGLVELPIQ